MKTLISIIVPAYNEEKNIEALFTAATETLQSLSDQYDFELIFIDDGSVDRTSEVIQTIMAKDQRVKFIEFSRNFGKEMATSAGLDVANGEAAIMIDADMQHPVESIPLFLEKWRQGAEVVVGVRNKNKGEGWVKKIGSYFYYKVINTIGETKIMPRATDYQLLDKKVIRAYRRFTEHSRMTRGLIAWLGFRRSYVYFDARERTNGLAGYSNTKLVKLAFSSIVAHSLFPLKLAGYMGIIITVLFGTFGFLLFIGKYILQNNFAKSFSGTAQLAILIVFLIGLVLACLGLVALYIANIQAEVANRPKYVIRKSSFDRSL